jgi:probable F420-dependent oxidoreductase
MATDQAPAQVRLPSDSQRPSVGVIVFHDDLRTTVDLAGEADRAGVHTVWTGEFYFRSGSVPLAATAATTRQCRVGSSILYGVGRSPLVLAAEARDLDELSQGRFVLGLGNGTRRMLRDWHGGDPSAPAVRMEELLELLDKLWRIHEGPVEHDGRFYRVNIVPTAAVPTPLRPRIPVFIAAANPRMIEVAGRAADGVIGHGLWTPDYVRDVVRSSIARGADRRDRSPADVEVSALVIASVHDDEEQARREVAALIAFYARVKAYQPMLALAGYAAEGAAVVDAVGRGDLRAAQAAVTDRMIDDIAVAGTFEQVRDRLRRYSGVLDHVILQSPSMVIGPERAAENVRSLIAVAGQNVRVDAAPAAAATSWPWSG